MWSRPRHLPAKVTRRKKATRRRNVYQQDELSPQHKVELSPVEKPDVSEVPLRSPALCPPAAPSAMPGEHYRGTLAGVPPGIPDDTAGLPVPAILPSPAVNPAAAAPVVKGPRLVWVERLQQLIPESSL